MLEIIMTEIEQGITLRKGFLFSTRDNVLIRPSFSGNRSLSDLSKFPGFGVNFLTEKIAGI